MDANENFRICVIGASESGKSFWTKKFLGEFKKKKNIMISVITPLWNEKHYSGVADKIFITETFDGVLEALDTINVFQDETLNKKGEYKYKHIIVFDDIITQEISDIEITKLFASGRHKKISLIFLTQLFFVIVSNAMKSNLTHWVIFRMTDGSIIKKICNGPLYNIFFDYEKKENDIKAKSYECYKNNVLDKSYQGLIIDIKANKLYLT